MRFTFFDPPVEVNYRLSTDVIVRIIGRIEKIVRIAKAEEANASCVHLLFAQLREASGDATTEWSGFRVQHTGLSRHPEP
jgi:hypothetical protein